MVNEKFNLIKEEFSEHGGIKVITVEQASSYYETNIIQYNCMCNFVRVKGKDILVLT